LGLSNNMEGTFHRALTIKPCPAMKLINNAQCGMLRGQPIPG
jgi:hypothetical protein